MGKFYWGNSVSSMQTEGGWNQDGKSLSVYDVIKADPDLSDWKVANDNYNNYVEDFNLMQDLGMNMYRFQISWSRCIKDGSGEINEAAISYYDKFIDDLISHNIEPMICLYHFDMPWHLAAEYNGFIHKDVLAAFIRFGKIIIDRFAHKVKYWLTFNEQNHFHSEETFNISGYLEGGQTDQELYQIAHNIMVGHATLCNYLHNHFPDAKIGGMLAYQEVYPATSNPIDIRYAREIDEIMNYTLLDCYAHGDFSVFMKNLLKTNKIDICVCSGEMEEIKKQRNDYIAFSYYASTTIDSSLVPENIIPNRYLEYGKKDNSYLTANEWGWQIDPEGFRDVLNKIYQRYQIPVFPVENGIGARELLDNNFSVEDDYRIDYHKRHLKTMFDAIKYDGVEILGYLGWGMIDILSSKGDMEKRYGLIYVNRENHDLKDMKRYQKKSYTWFKEFLASANKSRYVDYQE
ncbi:glycoside hydrolase family 1 protein [Enterococcus songbeiensis]|uniref:glycoside hydrolase family 1 protein n=1 Tax=Enterococcus songbeiensis TaxID=2559927 RepID=UPI0010F81456|nr:glycoside hydrolase family 1 protein [Enterococcus songbeiensis]